MANKVGYIIQLQDKFSAAARKITRSTKKIDNSTNKLDKTLKNKLGKSLTGVKDKAFEAAKGLGALATAAAVIKVGAGFEDAIAELSAITGTEGNQLKTFSDDILRLAKTSGFAQEVVAKAFTNIASAKSELLKDPESLKKVAAGSLLLAKAAGIEVPAAIRASVGALNQFGAGADQTSRFINVLAAGAKVGASQVGETADALKNAGTIAAQLGLSFESTNAILQVFAKNEVKGAEAGTALRGTLIQLEKLGGRFAPSVVGIDTALQNLANTQFTNAQLIKTFGNENLRTALILRKNVPLIRQWTKDITGTSTATDQATTRMDTFNQRLKKAGISLASIGIKIFTGLEPALSAIIDLFTFMLNAIDGVTSALGNLIGQFVAAVSILDFSQFDIFESFSEFGAAFGLESIKAPAPARFAPIQSQSGTIDSQITVKAEQGTTVTNAKSRAKGAGLNTGINMGAPG